MIHRWSLSQRPPRRSALASGAALGLLHMDITVERLRREFEIDLVATAPNVAYEIVLSNGSVIEAHKPSDFPIPGK